MATFTPLTLSNIPQDIQPYGSKIVTIVNTGTVTATIQNGATVTQLAPGADMSTVPAVNVQILASAVGTGGVVGSIAYVLEEALAGSKDSGPGNPNGVVIGLAGDYWFRTDTPATANQRIYICTGGTSWTALAV
jgi:hypothetical protein